MIRGAMCKCLLIGLTNINKEIEMFYLFIKENLWIFQVDI